LKIGEFSWQYQVLTDLFSFKHKTKVLICELTIEIENFLEKENHLKCE
jgi:hypothetical protein